MLTSEVPPMTPPDADAESIVCGNMFASFGPAPLCESCTIMQHEAYAAVAPISKDEAMFVRIATEHSDYWGRGYCGYWAESEDSGGDLGVSLIFEHNDTSASD